jgi:hypothetical protein
MLAGGNGRDVASSLRLRLDEIRKGLPEGVGVETVYDRTDLVDAVLRTVRTNLVEGAALVVAVGMPSREVTPGLAEGRLDGEADGPAAAGPSGRVATAAGAGEPPSGPGDSGSLRPIARTTARPTARIPRTRRGEGPCPATGSGLISVDTARLRSSTFVSPPSSHPGRRLVRRSASFAASASPQLRRRGRGEDRARLGRWREANGPSGRPGAGQS